jgi:NADPH:quinone reductase-like Zn-dependent oxidoreductase
MLAVTLTKPDFKAPLDSFNVGERPDPDPPHGWTTVTLKAASLNHHDVWSMRGVGIDPAWLPCVLGSDGAGVDADGTEVIIHPLFGDPIRGGGDETLDPRRRMLSDGIDGTFAERVAVPKAHLVPKPAGLSFHEAACLGTAWLTAYRMLFGRAALKPGETILIQGAGGGVATAVIALGKAAGLRVWVTSRDPARGQRAVDELQADAAFGPGERLPARVDAVMDSVGAATISHSLKSLRPGGRLVTIGATTGGTPAVDLTRVFLNQNAIIGSAMGTLAELKLLAELCVTAGISPAIDSVHGLADFRAGASRMVGGDLFGKVVFDCHG